MRPLLERALALDPTLVAAMVGMLGQVDIIKNDYHGNYSLVDDVRVGECAVDKLIKIGDQTISQLALPISSAKVITPGLVVTLIYCFGKPLMASPNGSGTACGGP